MDNSIFETPEHYKLYWKVLSAYKHMENLKKKRYDRTKVHVNVTQPDVEIRIRSGQCQKKKK